MGIPPRRLEFQVPEDLPRYFYDDNATSTLFFMVLSAFFPPGEDFFVRSVRAFREQVTDPELRAAVSGFIGQEVIHGREHGRLNEILRSSGIDLDTPERLLAAALWLLDRLPRRHRLVLTAFMEHFTATLAEQLLVDEHFQARGHAELLQLWLWHALEELEHKSVTYDVYQQAAGDNVRERRAAGYVTAAVMLPPLLGSWVYLLARERVWRRPRDLARGAGLLFGKDGFVVRVVPRMFHFGGRRFHPDRRDTTALEEHWREVLFGAQGTLRDQVRYVDNA